MGLKFRREVGFKKEIRKSPVKVTAVHRASQREGGDSLSQRKGTVQVGEARNSTIPSLPPRPFPFHPAGQMDIGSDVSSSWKSPGRPSCCHWHPSSPVLCNVRAGTGQRSLTFLVGTPATLVKGPKCQQACQCLSAPLRAPTVTAFLPSPPTHAFCREPKDREPSPRSATRTLPRRRKGFCECCQEAFEELHAVSPPCQAASPGLL